MTKRIYTGKYCERCDKLGFDKCHCTIRQYQLTDGTEVFADTEWFTATEAAEANQKSKLATDGNVWWEPVKFHPTDADYFAAAFIGK